MPKPKPPSPQELYRQRRQREEEEKSAYLPPGLINHGNTCFMNSVLQGLIATRLLRDLVHFTTIPPSVQRFSSTPLASRRSPQLTNGHELSDWDQPWVKTMPIGDMFLSLMYRSWEAQARRQREVLSPRSVLANLGQKYDQYLDFAQQDAHEFLRIILDAMRMEEQDTIKQRQPPLKKRRRTTLTPADPHTPLSPPILSEEDKLLSFVDMIFGGQLTSILVCQKCKHISQTYEDFNDISLSIKPEDYSHRKRDRLKSFAKRLTTFPSTASSSNAKPLSVGAVAPIQRPSSVPPTSREPRDALIVETHDDPTRRRSLDLPTEPSEDPDTSSPVTSKEDGKEEEADSDNSHVLVNVTGPEDKHVEFVEVQKEKKEKKEKEKEKDKKGDDGWLKLGRRISLTVGIGKPRERKSRSIERMGTLQDEEVTKTSGPSTPRTSTSKPSSTTVEPPPPEIQVSPPSAKPGPPASSSSTTTLNPSPTAPRFPNVQRSKSPKPPKPTAAETEYLRKILADVASGSPGNPFNALFKPLPHAHPHHPGPSVGGVGGGRSVSSSAAEAVWLGMSQFSGIEECLRMFTAVEVLDGENMVGCRRCWKIANGVAVGRGKDEDEESGDEGEKEAAVGPGPGEQTRQQQEEGTAKVVHRQPLPPLTPPAVHIPTSMSTPTVLFYQHLNNSATDSHRSISSLPTTTDDTTDLSSSAATSVEYLELKSDDSLPGGMPIPRISTTAPTDALAVSPGALTARPGALTTPSNSMTRSSSASSAYSNGTSTTLATNGPLSNYALSKGVLISPSPRVGLVYQNQTISSGSLPIPSAQRHHRAKDSFNTTDDESSGSGDESEGSVSGDSSFTSSGSTPPEEMGSSKQLTASPPTAGPSSNAPQAQVTPTPPPSKKLPRPPKPVIMRPAYKRYLVATPPPVLVIHLKRFQQIAKTHLISFSHGFKKLDDYVTFPEYFDLTPFLAPRKEDYGLGSRKKKKEREKEREGEGRCMYRLYAVVVHIGNMLGGHYVAYTALPSVSPGRRTSSSRTSSDAPPTENGANSKPPPPPIPLHTKPGHERERQWAFISDTTVRLTTLEEVLHAKAYICMYERC